MSTDPIAGGRSFQVVAPEGVLDGTSGLDGLDALRSQTHGARVLVAEDDADLRAYLEHFLGRMGWSVDTAEDGDAALARARAEQPDLVLTDVIMPRSDGFELLRAMRADAQLAHIPVVLVTGGAGEAAAVEGLMAGANDYIAKPFSARELAVRVGAQLEHARVRRHADELNAFLVRFSDAVRSLTDPRAVARKACRMLCESLGSDRGHWAVIDHVAREYVVEETFTVEGIESSGVQRYPLDRWQPLSTTALAGGTIVLDDARGDPRISESLKASVAAERVAASICVPVLVDGVLRSALAVNQCSPRRWTREEIALVESVASRCWAEVERARAEKTLRESEQRTRLAIRATRMVSWEWIPSADRITTSDNFAELYGLPRLAGAEQGFELVLPEDQPAHLAKVQKLAAEGGAYDSEFRIRRPIDGRIVWLEERAEAQLDPQGEIERVIGVTLDITERKLTEAALLESEERQTFLLKLSDALRPLTDPIAIQDVATHVLGEHLGCGWTYYGEVDNPLTHMTVKCCCTRAGLRNLAGVHPIASFALRAPMEAGLAVVVPDMHTDPIVSDGTRARFGALGMRSFAIAPSLKGGVLRAGIVIADTVERHWSDAEVRLLQEVAERTWASVERARTEEALRESEAKYRSLFEIIEEAYSLCEVIRNDEGAIVDYRILEANPAFARHAGFRVDEVIGRPRALWSQPRDEASLAMVAKAVETGVPIRFETFNQGFERWIDAQIVPRGDRFTSLFADITMRKRAELALRASEERQSFLLKLTDALRAPSSALEIQREAMRVVGEHLQVDRALYAEFAPDGHEYYIADNYVRPGVPKRVGRFPTDVFSGVIEWFGRGETLAIADIRQTPALTEAGKAVAISAGILAAIIVPLLKEGRLVAQLLVQQARPREWTADEVATLQETAERTWAAVERAKAENALRTSEERMRRALSIDTVGVSFYRLDGPIVDANAAYERMTGYDRAALRELRDRSALTAPEFRDMTERAMRDLEVRGDTQPYEVQLLRRDGTRPWALVAATRLAEGSPECVEFVLDITEQKELQQHRAALLAAVTTAHAEAQRANRTKDEFLATLGHELRTPLAAIMLWAGELRSRTKADAKLGRVVDMIVQSAETQSSLINDLLDLSRLTSGKLFLAPSPVSVASVVHEAIEVVRPEADAKRLSLVTDVASDLGTASLDRSRLRQVLWNLLKNATKFTPEGGTVTTRARRHEGVLELEVEDNGEGIAPEFMPHIFEKFRQADMSDTRQYGGLGIGLALCRQLVELQHGTIEAHSDGVGRGSRFTVRLPWISAEGAEVGVAPLGTSELADPLAGVRILLVEDDVNTRDAIDSALTRAGADVVLTSTAAEGLAALGIVEDAAASEHARGSGTAIDILVVDLGLPVVTGYDFIARVVADSQSRGHSVPPACAISAHARDIDRQRAIASGFDLYLAKPITADELITAVLDLRDLTVSPRA